MSDDDDGDLRSETEIQLQVISRMHVHIILLLRRRPQQQHELRLLAEGMERFPTQIRVEKLYIHDANDCDRAVLTADHANYLHRILSHQSCSIRTFAYLGLSTNNRQQQHHNTDDHHQEIHRILWRAIGSNTTLTKALLETQYWEGAAEALASHPTLRELKAAAADGSSDPLPSVLQILRGTVPLEYLSLHPRMDHNYHDYSNLMDAVAAHRTLVDLDFGFSGERFTDACAIAMSEGLSNKLLRLKGLTLPLSSTGALAICNGLAQNSSLLTLDLSWSLINDQSIDATVNALLKNHILEKLTLCDVPLSIHSAGALCRLVLEHKSLKTFIVSSSDAGQSQPGQPGLQLTPDLVNAVGQSCRFEDLRVIAGSHHGSCTLRGRYQRGNKLLNRFFAAAAAEQSWLWPFVCSALVDAGHPGALFSFMKRTEWRGGVQQQQPPVEAAPPPALVHQRISVEPQPKKRRV